MKRRAVVEAVAPAGSPAPPVNPAREPCPDDAMPLEDFMDLRFRDLLCLATEPQALTKALEAATKWVEVRKTVKESGEYGSAFTRRGGSDGGG